MYSKQRFICSKCKAKIDHSIAVVHPCGKAFPLISDCAKIWENIHRQYTKNISHQWVKMQMSNFRAEVFNAIGYAWNYLPVWVRMWTRKFDFRLKFREHMLHWKGRSSAWQRMWRTRVPFWENREKQISHLYGLSPVWVRICTTSELSEIAT